MKFFNEDEAKAFVDAGDNTIPEDDYLLRVMSIEPKDSDPNIKCFTFKVARGPYAGRKLRAWPSTADGMMWTMTKLIGDVVGEPRQLQYEDLEGHVFKAEVSVEKRKDNGEKTNRVLRLHSWDGDGTGDDEENLGGL
jgi:hypothetical protein